jgi:hypothetical protein
MTVRAKVLTPFPYSRDGIFSRHLEEGEVEDFPDDVFNARSDTSDGKKASLEKVSDDAKLEDPKNPADINWAGIGDNELVGIIFAKTGEKVNAGDMSHIELLRTAQAAMGYNRPRRRGAAIAGKQDDDRALGGVASPTPAVLVPNNPKPQDKAPDPDPDDAQLKVKDGVSVRRDTKKD